MKELQFKVDIEEGETGQFELFKYSKGEYISFMKEGDGIPKFFTLHEVEMKLSNLL